MRQAGGADREVAWQRGDLIAAQRSATELSEADAASRRAMPAWKLAPNPAECRASAARAVPHAAQLSCAQRLHRHALRRQSAGRRAGRRCPRHAPHADGGARVQPVRDGIRSEAAESGTHCARAYLYPGERAAVRRPSDGRRGRAAGRDPGRDQSSGTARRRPGGSGGGDRHRAGGRAPENPERRPMRSSPLPSFPSRPARWRRPSGSPRRWG